jgi:hypothetical protein
VAESGGYYLLYQEHHRKSVIRFLALNLSNIILLAIPFKEEKVYDND